MQKRAWHVRVAIFGGTWLIQAAFLIHHHDLIGGGVGRRGSSHNGVTLGEYPAALNDKLTRQIRIAAIIGGTLEAILDPLYEDLSIFSWGHHFRLSSTV